MTAEEEPVISGTLTDEITYEEIGRLQDALNEAGFETKVSFGSSTFDVLRSEEYERSDEQSAAADESEEPASSEHVKSDEPDPAPEPESEESVGKEPVENDGEPEPERVLPSPSDYIDAMAGNGWMTTGEIVEAAGVTDPTQSDKQRFHNIKHDHLDFGSRLEDRPDPADKRRKQYRLTEEAEEQDGGEDSPSPIGGEPEAPLPDSLPGDADTDEAAAPADLRDELEAEKTEVEDDPDEVKTYECRDDECDDRFDHQRTREEHEKEEHGRDYSLQRTRTEMSTILEVVDENATGEYLCYPCAVTFSKASEAKTHEISVHQPEDVNALKMLTKDEFEPRWLLLYDTNGVDWVHPKEREAKKACVVRILSEAAAPLDRADIRNETDMTNREIQAVLDELVDDDQIVKDVPSGLSEDSSPVYSLVPEKQEVAM
ncbi:hypothetical protein G3I44_14105 [Halogeometricum borinquense]|uniref:C2H2-type domain-containing protein n=1 Tax=Halogeometricum borinquense TaxID=60847 RepID=A0A6C0UJE9_9EURY|nr:hypothetical protein [Halogeometricum borinquense]QIB75320.1 hypothetical protein G3I44_14105 [Halogeometricum borinquense]